MRIIICKCGSHILVNDEDFDKVNQFTWECLTSKGGMVRALGNEKLPLSQLIMGGTKREIMWDHKDRDHHNNLRDNLRLATRRQNNVNRLSYGKSGYKGVRAHQGKWLARITVNYKELYLGVFDKPEDAARAYNEAALKYNGEFAVLNQVPVN